MTDKKIASHVSSNLSDGEERECDLVRSGLRGADVPGEGLDDGEGVSGRGHHQRGHALGDGGAALAREKVVFLYEGDERLFFYLLVNGNSIGI